MEDKKEKLKILLHHWIEHNDAHKQEFIKWANISHELGLNGVKEDINKASRMMDMVSQHLKDAQEKFY